MKLGRPVRNASKAIEMPTTRKEEKESKNPSEPALFALVLVFSLDIKAWGLQQN